MSWQDLPGWANFRNTYDRYVEEAHNGDIVVEVGVCYGKSPAYLAEKSRRRASASQSTAWIRGIRTLVTTTARPRAWPTSRQAWGAPSRRRWGCSSPRRVHSSRCSTSCAARRRSPRACSTTNHSRWCSSTETIPMTPYVGTSPAGCRRSGQAGSCRRRLQLPRGQESRGRVLPEDPYVLPPTGGGWYDVASSSQQFANCGCRGRFSIRDAGTYCRGSSACVAGCSLVS